MTSETPLTRILIIDDLFGRTVLSGYNQDRANLCGQYLLDDVTGDKNGFAPTQRIRRPVAEAVFCRGQLPRSARPGDVVENDLAGVLECVRQGWTDNVSTGWRWSLILLDLCFYTGPVTEASNRHAEGMPVGRASDDNPEQYFGLQILESIRSEFPELPVVILSSKSRAEVSNRFASLGAVGFIERDAENSCDVLRDYIFRHALTPDDTGVIAGNSKRLLVALREARRAALHRENVLIRGERGVGKELFAAYIHRQASRERTRPFIVVNSGALSPELYRSELFGHRRGSFTSADQSRIGAIEAAHGGDLFLDEIGNMPLDVQAGLLRVIEDRRVLPIGESTPREIDVRFISATNADLGLKVSHSLFLPDLLDRLGYRRAIEIPALRDRIDDIPLLVERFVRQAEASFPGALKRQITAEALEKLTQPAWLGNIRELRECVFKAVSSHPDVEHLVESHLDVPSSTTIPVRTADRGIPATGLLESGPLDNVVRMLASTDLSGSKPQHLNARLPALQTAYARLLAGYLRAALDATSKPTPDNPFGEVFIHPAVKLMTGDPRLTASNASDIIKRLLKADPSSLDGLLTDPLLNEAWKKANRLRPAGKKENPDEQQ